MARKVFYSFHYKPDNWRAAQVRSMGIVEGDQPASDNDWETITKGGDAAIKKWIEGQMSGKTCAVVLVGADTANRKWINHEITEAWNKVKGVVGIRIHGLKDLSQKQSSPGYNQFDFVTLGQKKMSAVVRLHDPPFTVSTDVYAHIKANLAVWIEDAIAIRNNYKG